jgi:hypothetical protein
MTSNILSIDPSFYFYARGFTITSYILALIELIFNSVDSYSRLIDDLTIERKINIQISKDTLIIQDYAEGMTAESVRNNFLMIGGEPIAGDNEVRGFFKRGAKDITNIGSITLRTTSRVTNLTTLVIINQDLSFEFLEENADNSNGQHEIGSTVTVHMTPVFQVSLDTDAHIQAIKQECNQHTSLRLILNDSRNDIYLKVADCPFERLQYQFPPDEKMVYRLTYEVPNYPGINATYTIYKVTPSVSTDTVTIAYPEYRNLVVDKTRNIVYATTSFKSYLESHDQLQYFYGVLDCPFITTLLHSWRYDSGDPQNPILIVDPSRINGLSIDHPFITELYSIAALKFEILLQKSFLTSLNTTISEENILQLTENLSEIGTTVVQSNQDLMYWKSDINGNLLRVAGDVQTKYVLEESDFFLDVLGTEAQESENASAIQEYITHVKDLENSAFQPETTDVGSLSPEHDDPNQHYVMAQSESKKFEIKLTKFNDKYRSHLLMTSSKILLYVNKNNPYVMFMLGITNPDAEIIATSDTTKRFLMDIMVETLSKLLTEARILATNAFSDSQKETFSVYNNIYQTVQLEVETRTFRSIADNTVQIVDSS